jgi:ribosomal protein S9
MQSVISVLAGIGNPDAPRGSREWTTYFAFYAKQRAEDASRNVRNLQEVLKKLKDHEAHKAIGLETWDDFCQREIGITADQAEKVLAAPPDATVGAVLGRHGGDRKSETAGAVLGEHGKRMDAGQAANSSLKGKTIGKTGGTTREYLTARLDRDHPSIAAEVHAGTISARAGAIRAGIIRELSPLEKAQAAFRRLAKEDRDAFDLWRAEQPL